MHFLSFARKDRGIVIDADIRFSFGFILAQFPPGNKVIEEEMCAVASFSLNEPLLKTTVGYRRYHN
jgi:hypothetical protein